MIKQSSFWSSVLVSAVVFLLGTIYGRLIILPALAQQDNLSDGYDGSGYQRLEPQPQEKSLLVKPVAPTSYEPAPWIDYRKEHYKLTCNLAIAMSTVPTRSPDSVANSAYRAASIIMSNHGWDEPLKEEKK